MASNRTRMDDALGLTDSPLLHEMFTAAAPTAAMWFEQQSASRGLDPAHSLFEHGELTDLLQDHPESDIGVDVLLVEGLWKWRYTAERAMCSIGLAEDAHARSDLVSELLTGP